VTSHAELPPATRATRVKMIARPRELRAVSGFFGGAGFEKAASE
jgi:hypothetical protein